MTTSKLLPLILLVALSACGQKSQETSAARSAPAASPAPSTSTAAAAPSQSTDRPSAAAAIAAASPTTAAQTKADAAVPTTSSMGAAGSSDLAKGEKVYTATCVACHGPGLLNAPKFGDKSAWAPRVAKGKDTLYKDALNGLNAMPPRGGNGSLKDDEVKAAVDYMVSKAS